MAWTEQRVDDLKKLHALGYSASQIAAELADHLTRNAVLGKIHRLGLGGVDPKERSLRAAASRAGRLAAEGIKTVPRRAPRDPMFRSQPILPAVALPPERIEDDAIPRDTLVALLDLSPAGCKWPVGMPGDAGFGFCPEPHVPGESYCAGHCRAAYAGVTHRRRDPHNARIAAR